MAARLAQFAHPALASELRVYPVAHKWCQLDSAAERAKLGLGMLVAERILGNMNGQALATLVFFCVDVQTLSYLRTCLQSSLFPYQQRLLNLNTLLIIFDLGLVLSGQL